MSDVVVFAGTTEGCEICSFLAKNKVVCLHVSLPITEANH